MTAQTTTHTSALEEASAHGEETLRAGQRAATEALDRIASGAQALRERGERVRESVGQTVGQYSDRTVSYIRDEPVRSVLVAAAVGAGLMALIGLLGRSRGSH